jgi:hypothetical protein
LNIDITINWIESHSTLVAVEHTALLSLILFVGSETIFFERSVGELRANINYGLQVENATFISLIAVRVLILS